MRRPPGVAVLVLLGLLAIAVTAVPASAQTGSDSPGGSLLPVVSISELPNSPAASAPSFWSALSYAFQQQISLGFWRWMPMTGDPGALFAPAPRPLWTRLGGLIRP